MRLLAPAEPAARTTIALLDMIDAAVVDRRTGRAARLSAGAQVQDAELTLSAGQRADLDFFELPPVPVAWTPESPTTNGYAATIGLQVPTGANGDTLRVLTLLGQGRTALRLDVAFVGAGVELRASAMRAGAGSFVPVTATMSSAALASGVDVHVVLDSRRGTLAVAVDGEPVGGRRPVARWSAGGWGGDAARPRPAGRCAGQSLGRRRPPRTSARRAGRAPGPEAAARRGPGVGVVTR